MAAPKKAFSLVELLVVISILALLVGILLPALSRAREAGRASVCLSNLRSVGQALVNYTVTNADHVVPSYNMTPGTWQGAPDNPLDGWCCILDRDGFMSGTQSFLANAFLCPDTLTSVEVMLGGQSGSETDPTRPNGYQDWPVVMTSTGGDSMPKKGTTIPSRGFNTILRTGYWLNSYNPIGSPGKLASSLYYTQSVGCATSDGPNLGLLKQSGIASPSALIVAADGAYMGRQGAGRYYKPDGVTLTPNRRVGYRHPGTGGPGVANTVFADGHAQAVASEDFPRSSSKENDNANVRAENLGPMTIFANPRAVLP